MGGGGGVWGTDDKRVLTNDSREGKRRLNGAEDRAPVRELVAMAFFQYENLFYRKLRITYVGPRIGRFNRTSAKSIIRLMRPKVRGSSKWRGTGGVRDITRESS